MLKPRSYINCLVLLANMFSVLVVLLALLPVFFAYSGVDVSSRVGTSSWSCLANSGYTFAIVRVYQSNGRPDANGPYTINDAHSGGMKYVDGYIFPCFSCGNPEQQMDDTISSLASAKIKIKGLHNQTLGDDHLGAQVGMLWIDVEGTQYWGSSQAANTDFISRITNRGVARGISMGIYTSNSQWSPITGGSHALSSFPLWYPHYDNNPSYSDWVSFGGWTKPSIKQYHGTTTVCSASVDLNYY